MNIKYCQRRGDFSSLAAAVGGAFFAAITTFAISLQNGGILPAQLPLFGPNFHVFSETQTSAGVLFKAGEYNYVRCPGTVIPNIISTPYGSVYWANEMSATDGKYYFSPATITLFPQLGADNTLTEFAADTTYYIYTSQDLVFHCGDAPDPVCGNGLPEVGEGCDDGNDDNHDDCTNACAIATCGDNFVQGIETCDGTDDSACPNLCLLDCSCGHGAAVCGDGVREDPEDCDNGTANSDTVADACRTDCTDHRCGDNVTDSGEFCDDGNNVNNDACTNACTIATCGDNIKYGLEECDGTDDSACNGLCLADCSCGHGAAVCGDGVREDPEECDDNNTDDGDGCSSTCELEIPYSCDSCQLCGEGFFDNCEETECLALGPCVYTDFFFGSFCDPDPEVCNADPVCGNGVQEPGEECDDSNLIDGDGCSATCETEIPYSCDSCVLCGDGVFDDCEEAECLTLGPCTYLDIYFGGLCDRNPVICSEDPVCGDGVREDPEECDEGDDNSNTTVDACRTDCKNPRCGDGVKDTGEGCDDGNNVNNDDCTNACTIATCGDNIIQGIEECDGTDDSACSGLCLADCSCGHGVAFCGDGVREDPEECDEGTANSNTVADACRTNCTDHRCGDGINDSDEECDDGNTTSRDGCSATCEIDIPYSCDSCVLCGDGVFDDCEEDECLTLGPCTYLDIFFGGLCQPDPAFCEVEPACGNGVHEPSDGEECDNGNYNSNTTVDACRTDCKNPRCGDGVKDTGEGCDDGNNVNNDDCTNACTIATCGDNIIQGIEECDDGSANSNTVADACRTNCTDHRCGDSVPDTGEACDDGNNVQTDDCINSCLFAICGDEHIWTGHEQCEQNDDCTGNNICTGCQCEATPANCGNGNREGDEECDDKNNVDTDDCTNACEEAECGDNIIWNGHENCDDGNNVNDDACTNTCEEAECGDSIVQNVTGEECDAGGTDTTTCDFDCSLPICGDNHLNTIAGEQCDDGNLTNGDGCSRICLREAICGDGIINGDETCDYYHPSAPPKCRTKSDPDPCTYCGDAILQESSTEQCDEGTYNSDTEPGVCRTNCMNPSCGDGTKDNGEECDNGDDNSDTLPNQCRTDCAEPHCGDNVEDTDEECDDGNIENGDGCDSTCKEETFDCSACYLCEITEPSPYGGYMGECDEETCLGIGTCIYEGGINGICTPDPTVCQIEEQACGKIKIEIDGAIDSLPSEPGMSTIVFEDSTISFSQGWKTLSNGTIIAPTFMNSFDPNTGTPLLNDGLVIYKKMSLGNLPINSIVKGGTMNAIITPANAGMRFYNDKIPHYLSVPFNFIGNNSRMARKINEAEIEIKAITQAGGYAGSQVRMNDEISISIDLNMAGGSPLVSPSPLKENLYGDLPGAPSFSISNISIDFDVCGSAGAIQHLLMDCGNGKPDDGEECDNGPANSNTEPDACRLDCTEYKCGDGIKDSNEQCDDGNTNDEDTCSNTCQALSCGDGITQLEYGEECDDENEINFDYCTNDCKDASCGDSIVQIVIGEECDDGNFEEGDGCTSYCSLEPGYLPVCEDTDFGINYSVNGTLRFNRTWMSDPSPIFYTDKCYFPTDDRSHPSEWLEEFYCDDGLRFANKNYECDRCCQGRCLNPDEPVPSEGCDINCPTGSRICKSGTDQACVPVNVSCCGNGWIDIGEECDDGNRINDDNCTNECMDNPICGDNNPQGDEECDDGNNVNDDECTNECKNPVCGDNILQSDEECDDGNTENYDGCSDQCNKELTMLCEGDEWIDLGTVTAPNSIGDPISSHSSVAYYKGELFVSMWTRRQVSNSSFTRGTIQRYANNNQWVPDYSKTGKMNLFTNSGSLYTYDIDTGTFYRRRKNGEEGTKWQYAGTPDLFDGSEIYDVLSTDDTFYVVRKSGGVFLYDGEDQFTKLGEDIPRIGGYFQMAMDGDTIHVSHKNIYATSIYEWNGTTWDLLPEESPPRTYTILGNSYNTAYIYNGTTFKAYVRNDRDYAEISCKSLTPVAKSQHRFRFWASLFDWAKEFLK